MSSISIIIVNYNTSNQIINCIQSLENENYSDIVVVDNASPNDNPDLILAHYPKVNLIKLKENIGFGGGCNAGYDWVKKNTTSEYVIFLNPDTVIESGFVDILLACFENKTIGAVTPLITLSDDHNVLWYGGGDFSWFKGSANVPGCGESIFQGPAKTKRFVTFASGCALMIRCDIFEAINGFDAKYFMYEEDAEISLAILKTGYKILYCPNAVVRHIGQASQGDEQKEFWMYDPKNPKLPFFVYYTSRNRFFTILKHGNLFQRLCFYVGFPLWVLRRGIPWMLNRRWDAFCALFKGIRDVLRSKG